MPRVVQLSCAIRPVRVALRGKQSRPPCPGSAGSEAVVHVAAVGFGEDGTGAFPDPPFSSVRSNSLLVQAGRILPGVDIARFRAGHRAVGGASHLRARQQRRRQLQCFAPVGHRPTRDHRCDRAESSSSLASSPARRSPIPSPVPPAAHRPSSPIPSPSSPAPARPPACPPIVVASSSSSPIVVLSPVACRPSPRRRLSSPVAYHRPPDRRLSSCPSFRHHPSLITCHSPIAYHRPSSSSPIVIVARPPARPRLIVPAIAHRRRLPDTPRPSPSSSRPLRPPVVVVIVVRARPPVARPSSSSPALARPPASPVAARLPLPVVVAWA